MIEPPKSSISANADDFRRIFLFQVHRLLYLGYTKLDAKAYAKAEEPDITGDLRGAMEAVIDDPNAETWIHFYYVEDEHQSYCQKSWMKPEPQAASFTPSLKITPAMTAGSNALPLSFRQ